MTNTQIWLTEHIGTALARRNRGRLVWILCFERRHRIPLPTYPLSASGTGLNHKTGRRCQYASESFTRYTTVSESRFIITPRQTEFAECLLCPRNEVEQTMADIWQELGIEQVGIQDNFFELGDTRC